MFATLRTRAIRAGNGESAVMQTRNFRAPDTYRGKRRLMTNQHASNKGSGTIFDQRQRPYKNGRGIFRPVSLENLVTIAKRMEHTHRARPLLKIMNVYPRAGLVHGPFRRQRSTRKQLKFDPIQYLK